METKTPFQQALQKIKMLEEERDILKQELVVLKANGNKTIKESLKYSNTNKVDLMIKDSKEAMKRNLIRINKEAKKYAKQIKS